MAAIHYSSADPSAPTLAGVVGQYASLLQVCLVGSGGIAYGSKPSAGWGAPYSGTNKVVLQAASGERRLLRIQDDGVNASVGARVAYARGYEAMTDVDTGTGLCPTVAQLADGFYPAKSDTAGAGNKIWDIVAADTWFFATVQTVNANATLGSAFFFGETISDKSGDGYKTALIGPYGVIASGNGVTNWFNNSSPLTNPVAASGAAYMFRSMSQTGTAITMALAGWGVGGGCCFAGDLTSVGAYSRPIYPDVAMGGCRAVPIEICCEGSKRGRLPGFYEPVHYLPYAHGAVVTDFAELPGRTVKAFHTQYNNQAGLVLIDLTGPWT